MTRGDDLPQDLRDFCFSFAGKPLDGPAGSKATPKSRLTGPLARSDAKKSLDDAAGTQRRQKVA
ncbi:hypothetical protein N425_09690 [Tannerella sp. oral taxon BU063 isolate Cell 2]|uniref:Uncharacterized protein n=1 Tax=Tannerella sp. oral taxon BU063 isolate Cell 2 TaxID=1411148 RepID=W2C365_9BACT|nr:hypothetical protein N425_09690 [Tannerella sp. oral taxon BU063 isolate Cell 2]